MYNYPFKSVVSITTDGAPSMMGRGRGLVALLKEDQTDLISYHYIIHQSVQFFVAICAESMLWSWQQWWNFLRASLSLQHRLLRGFLTEVIANYDDLVLHNNVRWHSKGRALERFWAIREEITAKEWQGNSVFGRCREDANSCSFGRHYIKP